LERDHSRKKKGKKGISTKQIPDNEAMSRAGPGGKKKGQEKILGT